MPASGEVGGPGPVCKTHRLLILARILEPGFPTDARRPANSRGSVDRESDTRSPGAPLVTTHGESSDLQLRRILVQRLESLQRSGVTQLPRVAPPEADVADAVRTPEPSSLPRETDMRATSPTGEPRQLLELLQQRVAACTLCDELAGFRTQTVFGVGNSQARLCFLGEAPGRDEDRLGEPFVGRAGKLLTDIIQKGMQLKREDVYILNVLKCRPPGNRNPTPAEAASCRPFLERQLEIIQPEFICCLGSVAAQNLLQTRESIGRLRGTVHQFRGIKVVATYHPAYLLRNPAAKKDTWEDIQLLMQEMGATNGGTL